MSNTVILGASNKTDRYAHKAHQELKTAGHTTIPVNPVEKLILGDSVVHHIKDVWQPIDTLTVYISPQHFAPLTDDIIRLSPRRIIFNPGTECPELYYQFPDHIELIEACTLVMLKTQQY